MNVGSDKARVWARELPLRSCSAKSIMLAMANYVDEHGHCAPSLAALARDTDQSQATVRRRLHWLQTLGVLGLFPQWIDEVGRINQDGRGRRYQDQIRLVLAVDIEAVRALVDLERSAADDEAHESPPISLQGSAPSTDGPPSLQGGEVPLSEVQGSGPPKACKGILSEESKKESPLKSPQQIDGQQDSRGQEDEKAEGWLIEFKRTYPIPTNRPDEVRTLAFSLNNHERDRCMLGARGVRKHRESNPKRPPPVVDPAKFLRHSALWDEYAVLAPKDLPKPVFVVDGGEEWLARSVIARIAGRAMPHSELSSEHGARGALFARPLPPDALRLAEYADPEYPFQLVEDRTAQFVRWSERIRDWTGAGLEAEGIKTGETVNLTMPDGRVIPAPGKKLGRMVPTEWPPPKGAHTATNDQTETMRA